METPHILVIDDNRVICTLIESGLALQFEAYQVSFAYDGIDGIEQAMNLRPDIILLDINMPRANGYQVTQHLRSVGNMTPIIMLSSNHQEEDKRKGYESGCNLYLTKPFYLGELCS